MGLKCRRNESARSCRTWEYVDPPLHRPRTMRRSSSDSVHFPHDVVGTPTVRCRTALACASPRTASDYRKICTRSPTGASASAKRGTCKCVRVLGRRPSLTEYMYSLRKYFSVIFVHIYFCGGVLKYTVNLVSLPGTISLLPPLSISHQSVEMHLSQTIPPTRARSPTERLTPTRKNDFWRRIIG